MGITVFLADDHAIVRDGLRSLLQAQKDMIVIGEAANGRDAVRSVVRLNPDIVLMDISMTEMNGIEAAEQICKSCHRTRVVILSMHASTEHISRALKAGVSGYLLKESAGAEVVCAIRTIHAGKRYLSQKISDHLWDLHQLAGKSVDSQDPLSRLSQREREVLQLVVEGKTSAEIARVLFLSAKTVDTYRSRLMQKLNLKDLPSLIKFAIHHGLTSLEQGS
jgi:DNA-binding NarL/FixJ family response regulator